MEFRPRLATIEMVRKTIEKNNRQYSIYQLWKSLPKKMKYQTYKNAILILSEHNELITDKDKKISLIERPKQEDTQSITREDIIFTLSHYGYELISYKPIHKAKLISIEDLMMAILIKFPEARFIEAIPILLINKRIDSFELYRKTYDFGLINKMGYLLEIALIIAKKFKRDISYLKLLLLAFEQKKNEHVQFFSMLQNRKFLERTTPELMKKWNLRGRFMLEDFVKVEYL